DDTELPRLTKLDDSNGRLGMGGAMPALEAPALDGRLEAARRLAKENPVAMASLVRGWVNKD
ncbi:MAG TPA: flagellar basal body M-ring protein FliF, partial [Aquabacterium sp.]|nr:flagellar basal body M-ring protein FliF [Aquabacterium sp.]